MQMKEYNIINQLYFSKNEQTKANQEPSAYDSVSPTGRIHGSQDQIDPTYCHCLCLTRDSMLSMAPMKTRASVGLRILVLENESFSE